MKYPASLTLSGTGCQTSLKESIHLTDRFQLETPYCSKPPGGLGYSELPEDQLADELLASSEVE